MGYAVTFNDVKESTELQDVFNDAFNGKIDITPIGGLPMDHYLRHDSNIQISWEAAAVIEPKGTVGRTYPTVNVVNEIAFNESAFQGKKGMSEQFMQTMIHEALHDSGLIDAKVDDAFNEAFTNTSFEDAKEKAHVKAIVEELVSRSSTLPELHV